jgi:hypothetical protein
LADIRKRCISCFVTIITLFGDFSPIFGEKIGDWEAMSGSMFGIKAAFQSQHRHFFSKFSAKIFL